MFLALPNTVLLDLAGPWDVFSGANWYAGGSETPYSLELVTAAEDPWVTTAGGPALVAGRSVRTCRGPVDTLVVPASMGLEPASLDRETVRHLRRLAGESRRVASVCGGAFILAAAGLLDGRRATTHWQSCDDLARKFPSVTVEPDRIFVRDENVYTSAGVTAGMDLALALVEEDLGPAAALTVARQLVMFVRRPGGQTQFSTALETHCAEQDAIRELLGWVVEHLSADLSVGALAARAHMSPRNFARVFRLEVGRTPARHIERLRVDAARQFLEHPTTEHSEVARKCGFGDANSMRRAFLRVLKVTPSDYRERFRASV